MTATAPIDLVTTTAGVILYAAELRAAIADCDLARARAEFRPQLCTIRVQRIGDRLVFTSTDSYMMIERTVPLADDQPAGDWTFLIDGDDVPVLLAHLKGLPRSANVALVVNDDRLDVEAAGRTLVLAAPEVQFPNTDHLWPDKAQATGSTIGLATRLIARLDRLSEAKSHLPARFWLRGDLGPVLVEVGVNTRACVMPMRTS